MAVSADAIGCQATSVNHLPALGTVLAIVLEGCLANGQNVVGGAQSECISCLHHPLSEAMKLTWMPESIGSMKKNSRTLIETL